VSHPHPGPSPEARTYTPRSEIAGPTLTCTRCGRSYAYPNAGERPIRCECGWWYRNVGGEILEEFRSRLGV
jgi:hypothetical protein